MTAVTREGARGGGGASRWLVVAPLRTELLFAPQPRLALGVAARSRAALAQALDGGQPAGVLVLGFCGGLRATLAPGDLIVADRLVDAEGDVAVRPEDVARAVRLLPDRAPVGPVVTMDREVDPIEKARLGLSAMGVDMESSLVARDLVARGIPFVILRIVLDALWEELPSGPRRALWGPRALACSRRLGVAARFLVGGSDASPGRNDTSGRGET